MKTLLPVVAGTLAMAFSFSSTSASAYSFEFKVIATDGHTILGNGTVFTVPLGGGVYLVDGAEGGLYGQSIVAPIVRRFEPPFDYAGDDQKIYFLPHESNDIDLDYFGLAMARSNYSDSYKIYYDTSTTDPYSCGQVGYCLIGPGVAGTSGLGAPPDAIVPIGAFTLTAAPEPATWSLLLTGIGAIGATMRLARRPRLAAQADDDNEPVPVAYIPNATRPLLPRLRLR